MTAKVLPQENSASDPGRRRSSKDSSIGSVDSSVTSNSSSKSSSSKNKRRTRRRRESAVKAVEIAEQEDLREAFEMFDLNGDGYIDHRELRKTLKSMGQKHTKEEVKEIIKSVDMTGNGKIDFDEFINYMKPKIRKSMSEDQLKQAFKVFDTDSTGYIDKKQLKAAMAKLGEGDMTKREINEMMDNVDITGTGRISFAEFRIMMFR